MYTFVTFLRFLYFRSLFLTDITLILLGAGSATRFKMEPKKQWLYSGDKPLWLQVSDEFDSLYDFDKVIVVSSTEEISIMKYFADYHFIEGGGSRQESLRNALQEVDTDMVLVSDIARCCLDREMIDRVVGAKGMADSIVPVLPAVDTLYMSGEPIDRSVIKRIQTPQLSKTKLLKTALSKGVEYTDDSSAIVANGGTVEFVEGSQNAHKLTTIDDLDKLKCIMRPSSRTLSGFGIDIHPFEEGKEMMLCGTKISVDYGFKAHSDGDVAIHAIIDAILGAAGFGDIGEFYPDDDSSYEGADSRELLKDTVRKIRDFGMEIVNIDITIIAQAPRLLPYKDKMRKNLADIMGIRKNFINIKATTAEKLGFLGRKEGVAVEAIANLKYFDWTNI